MSKIRKIGDYKFESAKIADKYDYLYKKYLDLPFDFSLQVITGTDSQKVNQVFTDARTSYPKNKKKLFYVPLEGRNYEQRLKEFESELNLFCSENDKSKATELMFFFWHPESGLPIDEQESFLYDCLMILKKHFTNGEISMINFFVSTYSILVLSEVMPGNVLTLNKKYDESKTYTDGHFKSPFGGNLYDLMQGYNIPSAASKIAQIILNKIISAANEHNLDEDDVDFIGDDLIRGYVQRN